jgi:RNA polymerase sigma-70 factor (sigma-E family)
VDSSAEERFTAWAQQRVSRLHRTAYLLCGDWHVAEDLVQDSLSRAALHWKRIEKLDQPDAYVRRILINLANARRRRRSSYERTSGSLPDAGVSDGAEDRAARDDLLTALRALPARQRAAVVLRYFDQLSEAETAQALGCAVGTVKSQTSRALLALQQALAREELSC